MLPGHPGHESLSIENIGIHKTLEKRKKNIMNAHHNESHFIHNFLHKLPQGHLQPYKHRCAIGKACFIRHFILTGNNIFRLIANFYFICTTFSALSIYSSDFLTFILFLSVQHTFISPVESARQ